MKRSELERELLDAKMRSAQMAAAFYRVKPVDEASRKYGEKILRDAQWRVARLEERLCQKT